MPELGQLDRRLGQLDADHLQAFGKMHLVMALPLIIGEVLERPRRVGLIGDLGPVLRFDREHERRAERIGRAHQGAQIHRLGNAFRSDCKISAHDCLLSRFVRTHAIGQPSRQSVPA